MAWSLGYAAVLWIHVACMTFWMGSMIFGLVLGGAGKVQAALLANETTGPMLRRLPLAYGIAIPMGVVAGILMGTVFGPVRSLAALTTPYGLTMLAALVLVIVAIAAGRPTPDRKSDWTARWRVGEAGILGAFTCMMLLRFGL